MPPIRRPKRIVLVDRIPRNSVGKVRRDELWQKIQRRYQSEFGTLEGGGYTNAVTHAFFRAYIKKYKVIPPEARRSWPWDFAEDLLPKNFDRWRDVPDDRPQMELFTSSPATAPRRRPRRGTSSPSSPSKPAAR
jgi:hypothetical protein